VIALWLGHERVETTHIYPHADLALKEKALARTKPPTPNQAATGHPTRSTRSSRRSNYADHNRPDPSTTAVFGQPSPHNGRLGIVDDAGLHPGLREDRLVRLGQAGEPVDAADPDVLDAALVDVVGTASQNFAPAVSATRPEHVALALDGHADGEVAGAGAHQAVLAHLHHQTVEVDSRVDRLQRVRQAATS
jgi:hypothetical protein